MFLFRFAGLWAPAAVAGESDMSKKIGWDRSKISDGTGSRRFLGGRILSVCRFVLVSSAGRCVMLVREEKTAKLNNMLMLNQFIRARDELISHE